MKNKNQSLNKENGNNHDLAIQDNIQIILQQRDSINNIQYIFKILKNIGLLLMKGHPFDDHLKNEIEPIFQYNYDSEYFILDDFVPLKKQFVDAYGEFIKLPIPRVGDDRDREKEWEEQWAIIRDYCILFVQTGVDIVAIRKGYHFIANSIPQILNSLNITWNSFNKISDEFFNQLYDLNKQYFYHFSDNISAKLKGCDDFHDDEKFESFIKDITASRESYPKDHFFRQILCEDEYTTIFNNIMNHFTSCSPTKRTVLYEHALAEHTIQKFILRICHHFTTMIDIDGIEDYILENMQTTLSENNDFSGMPNIKINGIINSVHTLYPGLTSWPIRKDIILNYTENQYNGGIFCSWKRNDENQLLIRFENFIPKEQMMKLIQNSKSNEKNTIAVIDYKDIYSGDLRIEFLEQSSVQLTNLNVYKYLNLRMAINNEERRKELEKMYDFNTKIVVCSTALLKLVRRKYTAAASPVQENEIPLINFYNNFKSDYINFTCKFFPSVIHLFWKIKASYRYEYFVKFQDIQTKELLSVFNLGSNLVGKIILKEKELNFDPFKTNCLISFFGSSLQ